MSHAKLYGSASSSMTDWSVLYFYKTMAVQVKGLKWVLLSSMGKYEENDDISGHLHGLWKNINGESSFPKI